MHISGRNAIEFFEHQLLVLFVYPFAIVDNADF